MIEEGVDFCGPQYEDEFNRLAGAGREFEWHDGVVFVKDTNTAMFCDEITYRLLPQKINIPENEPFRITSEAMKEEVLA